MKIDLLIIGAGASGLTAAYQAAFLQPELNIVVLERGKIPGRKLSAAGNGKCNVSNRVFTSECYYSQNMPAVKQWIAGYSGGEVTAFLERMGIILYEKNGYIYPVSNRGSQVTGLLYEKGRQMGVTYFFQTTAKNIVPVLIGGHTGYQVMAEKDSGETMSLQAEYVLLATGGLAAPALGGCSEGYFLARQLGLGCNRTYPVLSPVYVKDDLLSVAKGVRIDGVVTLVTPDGISIKEAGQIQINADCLSGIVMMDLSCVLNAGEGKDIQKDSLRLDILPGVSWDRLKAFIISQKRNFPGETVELLLSGIMPEAFVRYLLKRLSIADGISLKQVTDRQINRLVSAIKKLTFTPVIRQDFDKAQATGGGVAMEEVKLSAFESVRHPKLYLTGEILDIHGKCGGYNITFAILSAIAAVEDMIRSRRNNEEGK